jgi:hypothetical protein
MHIFINEGLDNSVFDVDMKKKFIQDVIEPYHDFLLHENNGFDGIGKVGLSWLSVNCKMQENAKNATKAINGSDFRGKAHRGHHTFTVVEEDDNMTLLKSTKNVEVTKELISPPLPALQRQNIAQLLRGMAAAQTPVRTQSSDSSIPMLNNAFSDLVHISSCLV